MAFRTQKNQTENNRMSEREKRKRRKDIFIFSTFLLKQTFDFNQLFEGQPTDNWQLITFDHFFLSS
jgi:hypothetical protein